MGDITSLAKNAQSFALLRLPYVFRWLENEN